MMNNFKSRLLCIAMLCSVFCYVDFQGVSTGPRHDDPVRLRQLQRELQRNEDDDGISLRQTVLPTLILTPAPTSPTGVPSASPSLRPTIYSDSPSDPPSRLPSQEPSNSLAPSQQPSLSLQPSLSQEPSYSPSVMPSKTPTMQPTKFPTTVPSLEPSAFPSSSPSSIPTESISPSMQPSYIPTNYPTVSIQPSQVPSTSSRPTRTRVPTNVPSESPTLFPTMSPSLIPTPLPPTRRPSNVPSRMPSVSPSLAPSLIPTMFPTLSVFPVSEPSITMVLMGFPARLSSVQREEWQNITSDHVLEFYQRYNQIDRGVIPVNVTNVTTIFKRQIFQPEDGRLEIEYEQTLVLGRFRETESDELLFVAPFVENTQEYVIDLLTAWDLDNLISLRSVVVGKEERTPDPPPQDDSGISSGGLAALAVSIVLGAVALVGFLFWDKKKKWAFTARGSAPSQPLSSSIREGAQDSQDLANGESGWRDGNRDGTFGSHQSWSNVRTPPPYDSNTLPTVAVLSEGGSNVDQMPLQSQSHHGRLQSRGGGGGIVPIPMRTGMFGRVRDESEITVTDSDGGHASDTGSDGFVIDPPALPSISDVAENFRLGPNVGALSPMHIPDEEEEIADHEYPPSQEMLGLARTRSSPSVLGFSMTIQDLE